MGNGEVLEGDEAYYDLEPAPKALDYRVLHEPVRTLHMRPAVSVGLGSRLSEAIQEMQRARVGCVIVLEGGRLAGILTERDILYKVLGTGRDPSTMPVDAVMTRDPETLTPDDAIVFAIQKMSVGGFRHVPLVDAQRRPIGLLSVKDVVDWLTECFPHHVLNVPPEPGRHALQPEGG